MTQKRIMRVSKTQPLSGSISTASYAFVFSDDINEWMKSKGAQDKDRARTRWQEKKAKQSPI